ncbi:MAG: ATP-binding cassette domain-containing protein [Bacteroidales bacterium]|nr:ATP-binding cassette domain-containing protein [Bacteroidales bacterium]
MKKLFEIKNLRCSYDKHYHEGESKVVLEIRDLVLPKGRKIFIVGESGIGKSTILEVLGLMNNTIVSQESSVFRFYENDNEAVDLLELWDKDNDDDLSAFRLKHFNFIFQSTNLMRNFTAYENIALTRMLQGYSQEEAFRKASLVLNDLGLGHIAEDRMAQELSGGQQQRLAFARAILPDFTVLFGDEPTGNLDSDNASKAMELLSGKLNELEGSSAIIVSHDMHLAATFADMIIKIRKEEDKDHHVKDEVTYYGVIDSSCVFLPSSDKKNWSNGSESYAADEFELFLKKI